MGLLNTSVSLSLSPLPTPSKYIMSKMTLKQHRCDVLMLHQLTMFFTVYVWMFSCLPFVLGSRGLNVLDYM